MLNETFYVIFKHRDDVLFRVFSSTIDVWISESESHKLSRVKMTSSSGGSKNSGHLRGFLQVFKIYYYKAFVYLFALLRAAAKENCIEWRSL